MRTLVLGDIHGHTGWESIILKENYDKVVFLGDYFDNFKHTPYKEQLDNFKEIVDIKKANPDNVVLLYGNHDHSYLFNEQCSGYSYEAAPYYKRILKDTYDDGLFDIIYILDDIVMSHAGISDYWMKYVGKYSDIHDIKMEDVSKGTFDFNFATGIDYYGYSKSQSPIWIRPEALVPNKIEGYRQIVGHTNTGKKIFEDNIWFNDRLPNQYMIVEDGEIKVIDNKNE